MNEINNVTQMVNVLMLYQIYQHYMFSFIFRYANIIPIYIILIAYIKLCKKIYQHIVGHYGLMCIFPRQTAVVCISTMNGIRIVYVADLNSFDFWCSKYVKLHWR